VLLVLGEGTVDEDLANADRPSLTNHHLEIVDETGSPREIPMRCARAGAHDEHAGAELLERQLVVSSRQQAMFVEVRKHRPLARARVATIGHTPRLG
jgi:hypothetical protein